ncbi:sensor histidine kinase [Prauserella cavernicola]|uniref:histidine kinase n=1 Tax=Prauserella cavernicola TaxID=2800127 RepID=A0A934QN89_9PSEU|nr:histidine kinase [Prauserella cavernicola]MBK1783741.1 sensor histidine kinase [Prauserella cavernicola]
MREALARFRLLVLTVRRPPERVRRLLTWWDGRVELVLLDVAVAAFAIWFTLASGDPADPHPPLHLPAVLVSCAALLVRRRWPVPVLALAAAAMAADATLLPLTVGLYSVAARFGLGWITGVAALGTVLVVLVPHLQRDYQSPMVLAMFLGLFIVGPALAGLWMRQRADLLAVLRDRAEEAERTRTLLADQAVFAERRRIAREMHDVVAHRVTAVALQAGALSIQAPDERTAQTAETIRSVSATALEELRGILRVLRDEAPQAGLTPVRNGTDVLASVDELVEDVTATGARVELQLPDPAPAIAGEVGRAVYRVVQESLTNAGKHAPHAAVEVRLATADDRLDLTVTNQLTPRSSDVPGSGYGLVGMRERVELAGGELHTGPTGDGRFRVSARFPVTATPAQEAT